jgi:hypothetical protein
MGGEPWTGDINLHVATKILSSSSPLEIQGLPSLKLKRRRRSAIDALLKNLVLLGLLNPDRTLESGAGYLKMSAVHSSAVLHVIVPA